MPWSGFSPRSGLSTWHIWSWKDSVYSSQRWAQTLRCQNRGWTVCAVASRPGSPHLAQRLLFKLTGCPGLTRQQDELQVLHIRLCPCVEGRWGLGSSEPRSTFCCCSPCAEIFTEDAVRGLCTHTYAHTRTKAAYFLPVKATPYYFRRWLSGVLLWKSKHHYLFGTSRCFSCWQREIGRCEFSHRKARAKTSDEGRSLQVWNPSWEAGSSPLQLHFPIEIIIPAFVKIRCLALRAYSLFWGFHIG